MTGDHIRQRLAEALADRDSATYWQVRKGHLDPDEVAAALEQTVRDLIADGESQHEWACPSCGATTRARMADHPTGDGAPDTEELREELMTWLSYNTSNPDGNEWTRYDLPAAANALLAGPLAPLLAERERVREFADEWECCAAILRLSAARDSAPEAFANCLRQALRGDA